MIFFFFDIFWNCDFTLVPCFDVSFCFWLCQHAWQGVGGSKSWIGTILLCHDGLGIFFLCPRYRSMFTKTVGRARSAFRWMDSRRGLARHIWKREDT